MVRAQTFRCYQTSYYQTNMQFTRHLGFFMLTVLLAFYVSRGNVAKMLYDFILPPISTQSEIDQIIAKEALLDATLLIQLYGYPAENHTVVTDDGYLITLHRIPRGKNDNNKTRSRIPIYLQHGAFGCSSTWVDSGEKSWGFLLADAGYDVWMGNFRNNSYTRKLFPDRNTDGVMGWDKLSIHEVPTIVDYILKVTGYNQILAIGHSMGTTAIFAALSVNKELNSKIKGFVALSPVCIIRYSSTIFFRSLNFMFQHFGNFAKALYKRGNLLPKNFRTDLLLRMCAASRNLYICKVFYYSGIGYNPNSLNQTRLLIYAVHGLDSFPDLFVPHWFQAGLKNKMIGYDYGREENIKNYKQEIPTEYNLTKIQIPVAVLYSANDALSNVFDVELLCRQLPNLMFKKLLQDTMATHTDILFHEPQKLVNTILPVLSAMWN